MLAGRPALQMLIMLRPHEMRLFFSDLSVAS